jgi:hypothetical protein
MKRTEYAAWRLPASRGWRAACGRALCSEPRMPRSGRARSYRAHQSDDRAGIEGTWLGDKAETASRPAAVLAR